MSPIAMTLVFAVTLGAFAWSAIRRWRLLMVGTHEPTVELRTVDEIVDRVRQTLVYAFGQRKMPKNTRYRVAGIAHMSIFIAFQVLLLNSVMLWIRGYDADFDFFGLLHRESPLGMLYNLVKELAAFGAIVGTGVFFYYRVIKPQKRMSLGFEGVLILFIIASMMVADYVYVGGNLLREATTTGEALHWHWSEPFGSAFALGFSAMGLSPSTASVFEHAGFWYHATWVLLFLNILPFSKHFHIITAIPNVFFGSLDPKGKLPDVDDIEGKIERDEPLGVAKVEHFTWKNVLDFYTCTECGRCSDNCPAYTTGKKLSPKHLTLALRDHLYDLEPHFLGETGIVAPDAKDEGEKHVHGDPPEGYRRNPEPVDLIGDIVDPEVLWACTTCRACEEQCPVNISYVDKIVEMRRAEMMLKNEFPHDLAKAFQAIEVNGNPWNLPAMDRGNWADGLEVDGTPVEVPLLADHPDAEVVYWVGCAANYDDQAKKVARAVAKLLHHAGVDFAIMGSEATCTGDPARRAGNEYLFQMLAEAERGDAQRLRRRQEDRDHGLSALLQHPGPRVPELRRALRRGAPHGLPQRAHGPGQAPADQARGRRRGLPRQLLPRSLQRRLREPARGARGHPRRDPPGGRVLEQGARPLLRGRRRADVEGGGRGQGAGEREAHPPAPRDGRRHRGQRLPLLLHHADGRHQGEGRRRREEGGPARRRRAPRAVHRLQRTGAARRRRRRELRTRSTAGPAT
jgi:formate hydrogenlyase subunit 6/NADH:ubiquinone oxidoreductase subunit I